MAAVQTEQEKGPGLNAHFGHLEKEINLASSVVCCRSVQEGGEV